MNFFSRVQVESSDHNLRKIVLMFLGNYLIVKCWFIDKMYVIQRMCDCGVMNDGEDRFSCAWVIILKRFELIFSGASIYNKFNN